MKPSEKTAPISAAVVLLALTLIGTAGFIVYRKTKGEGEKGTISGLGSLLMRQKLSVFRQDEPKIIMDFFFFKLRIM